MVTTKVTRFQFYALIVVFILGVSPLFYFGLELKQDAWLAMTFAMLGSMLLFGVIYGSIFSLNRKADSPIEIMDRLLGKKLAKVGLFIYGLYFMFISSFVLRDIVEIVENFLLFGTPRILMKAMIFLLVLYGVTRGVENIFRSAEMFLVSTVTSILIIFLLIGFSDVINFENLQPVSEHDVGSILKYSIPLIIALPFGEMVIFTFVLPIVGNSKHIIKVGLAGILTAGILLITFNILIIVTIGPNFAANAKFPALHMIRLINIANFIQRVDAIFVLIVITGSVFQLYIYGYALGKSFQHVFGTKTMVPYLIIGGTATIVLSFYIGRSNVEYLNFGLRKVPYYVNLPFEVIFPIILLIISIIRHFIEKKRPPVKVNHVEQKILEKIN